MIDRRSFLKGIIGSGVGACSLASCPSAMANLFSAEKKRKPNFIIIFCDDMGYADIGPFGATGYKTPHLDRMAAEGGLFTDFYVSSPACSPSRASLMTGCYPQRVGLPTVLGPNSKVGISKEETTIPEMLKPLGYATACYGKWHLGDAPEFLPTQHGFDDFFGLPYSHDMSPKNHPTNKKYPSLPLMHNETVLEMEPDINTLTTKYTEHAVAFIEANKGKPFFLYLAHSLPHVPLGVSEKFRGKSLRGLYGDVVMEIDWSVGQVLEALKKNNIDENTLVIFSSDNGPWLNYGNHAGIAYPLREGKGTCFEGGFREPSLMRWPGTIPAGHVCRELATTMDILPTIAYITGAALPELPIDGKNIYSLMTSSRARTPHEVFYYRWPSNLFAVRSGKWKLVLPHNHRSERGIYGGLDGVPKGNGGHTELALFDLENDPGETINLVKEHPKIVKRLEQLLELSREDLGDSDTDRIGKNVRPPGKRE